MKLPELPPLPEPDFENHDNGDVFGCEKTYFLTPEQIKAYATTYAEAAVKAEHDRLMDGVLSALQGDLENGVKWLNEIAAKEFKDSYPALNEWLRKENT